jgi:hypothetical protein
LRFFENYSTNKVRNALTDKEVLPMKVVLKVLMAPDHPDADAFSSGFALASWIVRLLSSDWPEPLSACWDWPCF